MNEFWYTTYVSNFETAGPEPEEPESDEPAQTDEMNFGAGQPLPDPDDHKDGPGNQNIL
jgi:hypothetical protein